MNDLKGKETADTTFAFSSALALESVPMGLLGCKSDDLVKFARTVAYKVFHNLKHGYPMSKDIDPITVDGIPAPIALSDHYEPVPEMGEEP